MIKRKNVNINNIEDLRDHVIESISLLSKGEIEVNEMSIIAKSAESVASTVKLQLQYAGMRNEVPDIKFLQSCNKNKLIENKS